jgi:hypothetical protein
MNLTKIEWTDWTLNPIVGCNHGCSFCYARKQAKRQKQRCNQCHQFVPHPHLERLKDLSPRQKPKKIFIDSMWDWNSSRVEEEWLMKIIDKMKECSQHTFQILSKRPKGYERFEIELEISYPPFQCGYCNGKGVNPNGRECIACHGEGKAGQLNFTEENVRAFVEFCRNSGGFDVYSR